MNTNRNSTKNESMMASALLATAFVVINARSRAIAGQPVSRDRRPVDIAFPFAKSHTIRALTRLNAALERRLNTLFHCAIPNGLEPHDFDLNDLTQP